MSQKIYIPGGVHVPGEEKTPQESMILMDTTDGERRAFRQVAVALMSPDVLNLIAEAVARRIENGSVMQADGSFAAVNNVGLPDVSDPIDLDAFRKKRRGDE